MYEWLAGEIHVHGSNFFDNLAGRTMNRVMMELKDIWLESNFTASVDELVTHIPQILEEVSVKANK